MNKKKVGLAIILGAIAGIILGPLFWMGLMSFFLEVWFVTVEFLGEFIQNIEWRFINEQRR